MNRHWAVLTATVWLATAGAEELESLLANGGFGLTRQAQGVAEGGGTSFFKNNIVTRGTAKGVTQAVQSARRHGRKPRVTRVSVSG